MPATSKRSTLLTVIAACLALSLVGAASASAAGPTIKGPKRGAVLARGSQPTFKVRDTSSKARRYRIYMTISTSKKTSRKTGDLLRPKVGGDEIGTFTSMRRKGTVFSYKAEKYSFPTWYMNRRGKYYWQAYHIDCSVRSCHVHSKVSSFIVR